MFDRGNKKVLRRALSYVLLQMLDEEVGDTGKQMLGSITSVDAMVTVRVDVHIELLVGLYQGFAIFRCVAQVYVIVCRAMYQEEFAMELIDTVHGR